MPPDAGGSRFLPGTVRKARPAGEAYAADISERLPVTLCRNGTDDLYGRKIFGCQSTKAHPVFGVPGNESTPMTTSGLLTCRRIPAPGGQHPLAFPSGDMQQSTSRFLKCTVLIAPSWESPPIGCTDFGCPQMPVSLSAKGAEKQKSCTFRCNFFCFGDDSTVFRR